MNHSPIMKGHTVQGQVWPELPPIADWEDTFSTLHMWVQIAGKIRLECSPWVNHSWGSALYVTPRGITTSAIPWHADSFTIDFDFVHHQLHIFTSKGSEHTFDLVPMSVADFYHNIMQALQELGIEVRIFTRPVEVEVAIPFENDTRHMSYDGGTVHRFWEAMVQADRIFKQFRARFTGKSSPVHLFWGAFDLAVTRFSGRTAPKHPGGAPNCADWVMEEAYSHELSSAGFWPGAGLGEAAFYAYAYPEPDGYPKAIFQQDNAYYHPELREFILPYKAVQTAADPDATLLTFLQSSYEAEADLAGWDRKALERRENEPPRYFRQ